MNPQTLQSSFPDPFPPSWADSWGEDEYGLYADLTVVPSLEQESASVIQRFRWIAPGDYLMGSPKDEPERFDREEQHKVTLSNGYWLADTAVTQESWQLFMGENPASFKNNPFNPVKQVSWNDSQKFIDQFNEIYSGELHGLVFRLPTEAEWEHACRAGTTTPFSFGENISSEQVNFDGSRPYNNGNRSEKRSNTVAVKTLPPNAWGLYEMHGNVWEWCADAWREKLRSQPMIDPCHSGDIGADRVIRGGSWFNRGRNVRSAYRLVSSPGDRSRDIGLRLSIGHELSMRSAK